MNKVFGIIDLRNNGFDFNKLLEYQLETKQIKAYEKHYIKTLNKNKELNIFKILNEKVNLDDYGLEFKNSASPIILLRIVVNTKIITIYLISKQFN